jgi:adenylate kinase family enzyme
MNKKVLFVIGPAGSGKTTISKQIASMAGVEFISSGDIVRSLADAHQNLVNGDLYYNDNAIMGEINDQINQTSSGVIIIDGVPRTEGQISWINKNMSEYSWSVVYITAPRIKRIKRLIKRNRDSYDTHDIILKRISKDDSNMARIRDLCWHVFKPGKVKYVESAIDGDTSSEVDMLITLLSTMEV